MFHAPRQLFHRSGATAPGTPDAQAKTEEQSRQAERHPAMRGLDVSPVHGHHCICARCEQHEHAA